MFFTVRPLKTKIKTVECLKPRISNIIEYWSINNLAKSHDCAVFCCWVVLQNVSQQFIVLTMGMPYLCSLEIMQTSGFSIATNLISCSKGIISCDLIFFINFFLPYVMAFSEPHINVMQRKLGKLERAIFSKRKMLSHWKLAQKFIFKRSFARWR